MEKYEWADIRKDIADSAETYTYENPQIRWGQAVFNIARDRFIEVEKLRGTKFDCFHDSDKTKIFLDELGKILTFDKLEISIEKGAINNWGDDISSNYGENNNVINFGVTIKVEGDYSMDEAREINKKIEKWIDEKIFNNPRMVESLMLQFN